MEVLKEFRASAAEAVTSMTQETQRVKRRRKQLSEVVGGGKARLNAVLLGEMMFVREAAKLNLGTDNLTVRGVAARWVAFWALLTADAQPDCPAVKEREKVARRLLQLRADQVAQQFAVLPLRDQPTWKNVVWSNDTAAILDRNDASVVINLKSLGEQMASRTGTLVERGGDA